MIERPYFYVTKVNDVVGAEVGWAARLHASAAVPGCGSMRLALGPL